MARLLRRACWALFAVVALAVPLLASAEDRGNCELLTAGNDFYTVYMWAEQDNADRKVACNIGPYGVLTGPNHPAGAGLQVLQDGANPATSFNSVRSYTTGTDYMLTDGSTLQGTGSRGFSTTSVAQYGFAEQVDADTLRATFYLPGPDVTPDSMTIIVEVSAQGASLEDAAVSVSTTISNHVPPTQGGQALDVAIRHLWDFAVDTVGGEDAGPALTWVSGAAFNEYDSEHEWAGGAVPEYYELYANENEPPPYVVVGTGWGPARLEPTPPDRLQYVCAPLADGTVYDYQPSGETVASEDSDCSPEVTGDSGAAYYFESIPGAEGVARGCPDGDRGCQAVEGILIPAGGSYTVIGHIFTFSEFTVGEPALCLSLELDATQTSASALGVNGLQNNDVVCGEGVLEENPNAARGDEDDFELFFDGSDVGITRIVDGMDIQEGLSPNGGRDRGREDALDVLLSFNIAHSIPPLGLVLQSDIIRFVADQNGNQTQGHFERFFDGSDIGLTAGGEDIDAFVFEPYFDQNGGGAASRGKEVGMGDLFFSTSGNGRAMGLSWRDEDIVACFGYNFTPSTGGDIDSSCEEFVLFFDGSSAGLAANSEDVDAFSFGSHGLYLSTKGNFEISAPDVICAVGQERGCADRGAITISGRNEDVFACQPGSIMQMFSRGFGLLPITYCGYVAIVFDGSDYGLGPNNVYSIDILRRQCILGARGIPCEIP